MLIVHLFVVSFFLFILVLEVGCESQEEVCTAKAFKPPDHPVENTTDRSKAVVPMLFLFCVAL